MTRLPKLSLVSWCAISIFFLLSIYIGLRLKEQEFDIIRLKEYLRSPSGMKKTSSPEKILKDLRENHLNPPSTLPYNFTGGVVMHDATIGEFINNVLMKLPPHGFFFEAGALDGERGSNTLWLEQRRNWTGILVEANPFSYKHLRYRHRKAWSSNSCVSVKDAASSITFEIPYIEGETSINWMVESNARLVDSEFHTYNDKIKQMSKFYNVTVDCYPLSYFFQALNVNTVDFLSLDVQGGEKSMLLNFPHDEILIKYILVEYLHFEEKGGKPEAFNQDFVDKMDLLGFRLIQHSMGSYDYYFVNKMLE